MQRKRIAILGSTGSIGTSALEVIDALGPEYELVALTGHSNVDLLCKQVQKFNPAVVGVTDERKYSQFKASAGRFGGQVLCGPNSLVEIASSDDVDIVLCAVVGAAGLPAVLAAAQAGKTLAIANKEPLVVAGRLLTETAKRTGA